MRTDPCWEGEAIRSIFCVCATSGAQVPPAVPSSDGAALCPAASVTTHPETRGRPGLLGDHTELGGAEAHVLAEESAHLHFPDEAVTTVQHRRHCSHRERQPVPVNGPCCPRPPEAQPESPAPASTPTREGEWGHSLTPVPLLARAAGVSTHRELRPPPGPPAWPWGVVVTVPASSLYPAEEACDGVRLAKVSLPEEPPPPPPRSPSLQPQRQHSRKAQGSFQASVWPGLLRGDLEPGKPMLGLVGLRPPPLVC